MSPTIETIEAEALLLSVAERALLVERLIASLDIAPDVAAAWATEIERRHAEIENGSVELIPGPDALAQVKAEFA